MDFNLKKECCSYKCSEPPNIPAFVQMDIRHIGHHFFKLCNFRAKFCPMMWGCVRQGKGHSAESNSLESSKCQPRALQPQGHVICQLEGVIRFPSQLVVLIALSSTGRAH